MFSMNLFTISIGIIFVFAQAKDHPTLPTQWTAITIEPGAGEGQESYNFVAEPSTDNPSSMWSRYKGCQRLIHVDNYSGGTRYLLGCESVKCCKETQSGNQVEFQIPNVQYSDPTREVEITYTGNVTITNFDEKMVADLYSAMFRKQMGAAKKLFYNELEWGDSEAISLSRVIASGALDHLKVCWLPTALSACPET